MRGDRALWVTLGLFGVTFAAYLLREKGPSGLSWMPPCLFQRLTALHCPGCGMTRAAHAALHGNVTQAFRYNPVGMILLPMALSGVGLEILHWVRGKPSPLRLYLGARAGWVLLVIIVSFWILRNIPHWPFTLLAPPAN